MENSKKDIKQEIKISTYGLFYGKTVRWINTTKEQTPLLLARIILKRKMKEEGEKFNTKGRIKLLKEWAEHYEDISDENQKFDYRYIADSVADHYIYCNGLHIIERANKTQISNELRGKINEELVNLFEDDLEIEKEV